MTLHSNLRFTSIQLIFKYLVNYITRKFLLITLLLLFCNLISSQELQLELNGKKADYFINLEKKLKSEPYDSGETYFDFEGNSQPLIFLRKEKDIPNLLVYYYFSTKDSTVSKILYEWDVLNFDKGENNVKPLEFQKKLIEKYNSLLSLITSKYKLNPSTTGDLEDLSKIDSTNGLRRKDVWILDNMEIMMYTTISNYYSKKGMVTKSPTHRIRLYIERK